MAKYNIVHLNYISSGDKRTFINMDVQVENNSKIPIAILRKEIPRNEYDPLSSNIVLEQREGHFLSTNVICEDYLEGFQLISADVISFINDASVSTLLSTGGEVGKIYSVLSKQPKYKRVFDWWNHIISQEGDNKHLILDEIQDKFCETGDIRPFFRIMLPTDTQEYRNRYLNFTRKHMNLPNQTYVYDSYIDGKSDNVNKIPESQTKAMYDMQDIVVKSDNMVADSEIASMDERKTEDIYTPQQQKSIIGFVGCGEISYIMFDKTQESERTIGSSLKYVRESENFQRHYNVKLENNEYIDTYLYKERDEVIENSDFSPRSTIRGIEYNYVANVDHDGNCYGTYTNGNIYGGIIHLKNSYDSVYTMNMSDENSLVDCRTYCGIGEDRNNVYFKYYDNIDYLITDKSGSTETFDVRTTEQRQHEKYPYQKIEYYIPNGITNTSKHKSNFFSVRICNSDLNSSDEKYKMIQFQQLKKDITNAIREICNNIAPANTQLFDVQFSSEGGE